jgi:hypothetical protein
MKKLFLPAIFSVLVGLGCVAYAQNPDQQAPPSQQQAPPSQQKQDDQAQKVSLVGCLTKGTGQGEYVIADQKSGEKVTFAAPDKIEKFLNQTVQLSGRVVNKGGDKVFQPESIASVSSTCESTPK